MGMGPVDIEVAVIGAGAAGLAAATELRRHGRDCLVIEARARLGGRAHTDVTWLGSPFDLGASFIHAAEQGNPWAGIAMAHGHAIVPDRRRRLVAQGGVAGPGDTFAAAVRRVIPNPVDACGEWRDGVGCSDASPSIGCSPEHGGAGPALSSGPATH